MSNHCGHAHCGAVCTHPSSWSMPDEGRTIRNPTVTAGCLSCSALLTQIEILQKTLAAVEKALARAALREHRAQEELEESDGLHQIAVREHINTATRLGHAQDALGKIKNQLRPARDFLNRARGHLGSVKAKDARSAEVALGGLGEQLQAILEFVEEVSDDG